MRLHRAGEFGDTVAQFQRGEAAHRAGVRRIIDQGNAIAMPGGDMAVERVVAGSGLGADEPAVEGGIGRIDRESVVEGKSVSVRVGHGGGSHIKKKIKIYRK